MNSIILSENKKVIFEMENNLREKFKYVASKFNSMRVENIKGVSVVDTALSSDTFNTAFGGQIQEDVAVEVFSYYKKNNQPMAWWIGSNSASESVDNYLKNAGFLHTEADIGMVCDLTQVVDNYVLPEKLKIIKCLKAKDFADFGKVLSSIFDPPDNQVQVFYNKMATLHLDDIKDMVLFVGYEGNHPVATSCLFVTDVAGIFDVATCPQKRNLGYGSMMFYRALIEAKRMGFKRSVLQASLEGMNIYKRFGFKELCQFNVWNNQLKT